ncbi:ABC transporter ATP-binding protein [Desulforamulus aquiferis]|uniref:ABC transporter ATP-binding protein n=1 Tax=Desulforamulus aquiferis TaxID=1397668 RepID=A0AAW7ZFR0_9FIRM|nr:ABC transporter ATP-binding protein [Desulforamulus aquiferis]MDO7787620.1 ABC transporter ATP-binding protein [Desulforamulus aquiferis]
MKQIKLSIEEVCKVFNGSQGTVEALQSTSFKVSPGEFVTILGPSGCGKSTILRVVAGLVNPSSGEVLMDGQKIIGPGPDRGMVFQSYTLFPWLTVQENIEFGLNLSGVPAKQKKDTARQYLQLIGLTGFENNYPVNLSGGMKQRVAIARALANNPEVLLMDEPFGALDAQTRTIMQELLLKVWEATKKTILFVTHDVEEAIFLGDNIYIMTARPGKIKEVISVDIPRPRSYEVKELPEFLAIKHRVLQLIREESIKAAEVSDILGLPVVAGH